MSEISQYEDVLQRVVAARLPQCVGIHIQRFDFGRETGVMVYFTTQRRHLQLKLGLRISTTLDLPQDGRDHTYENMKESVDKITKHFYSQIQGQPEEWQWQSDLNLPDYDEYGLITGWEKETVYESHNSQV